VHTGDPAQVNVAWTAPPPVVVPANDPLTCAVPNVADAWNSVPAAWCTEPSASVTVNVAVAITPSDVPLKVMASVCGAEPAREQLPSALWCEAKLATIEPLPLMGPATERSGAVIWMVPATASGLEQPLSRDTMTTSPVQLGEPLHSNTSSPVAGSPATPTRSGVEVWAPALPAHPS